MKRVSTPAPCNLAALPLPCPRTATWNGAGVANVQFVPQCPLTFAFESDRTVLGAYASLQWRPTEKLILDAGVRAQVAPTTLGKRGYDPVPLASAAVVYEFIPDWHVKLNFTQGFRPPVFNNTDSNAKGVQIAGNPNLEVERSAAFQTEVNARLLKGVRHIRELDFRADYSYTRLDNFIAPLNGFYTNTGARGIHSAEVLAKLYLKGDHRLELGYTWLRTDTDDKGLYRSDPQHWFNIGAVISLVPRTLELNGTVRVFGAFEDPNMRVETRNLMYDPTTGWARIDTPGQVVKVFPTDEVMDRIPPAAELEAGIRWRAFKDHLILTAQVFNAMNVRHYTPDAFMDFEVRNERVPTPYEDFSFFVTATYAY